MTPSSSPAPAATQAQSSVPATNAKSTTAMTQAQAYLRRKKETSVFVKNPSRPVALTDMQATQRAASPSVAEAVKTVAAGLRASQATSDLNPPAGLPTPQSTPNKGASSSSGASTPSTSQASAAPATGGVAGAGTSSTPTSEPAAPAIPYQDFRIVSTDRHGWKYDVMKFESRKPIDVNKWPRPVKLNRKEIKRNDGNGGEGGETAPTPVGPMLGPDGKPVIGADGRVVMVDAEGRPIHDSKPGGSGSAATKKDDKSKKKKFQKKTRQVFLVPEHIRQLRREERYPWVMEDASGKEVWEGRMEEANKAELYALLMPAPDSVFRFVPAHRWYKFQKKRPQQHTWSLEEAERMMAKMQKNKDQERWAMRLRNGNPGGASLVHDVGGSSLGPGGRRLRTVDTGMRGLFDEDDEEGVQERRRRERERGGEGDLDEMEYEEDFADDEEKMEPEGLPVDEEAKELEERLKREYHSANKTREGYIDESDEEEDADNLTGVGKDIKKLVKKIEKNAAYDSDEDKNPYASSEEEEEEEIPQPTPTGPAVQDQSASRPGSTPQSKANSRPTSKPPSRPGSRTGSPAPPGSGGVKVKSEGSPTIIPPPPPTSPGLGMGGHSVVAKRATSPKPTKMKSQVAGSGAVGVGSRATSPLAGGVPGGGGGSRAGTPVSSPGASRATSPVPSSPSKKRKAEGEMGGTPGTAVGVGAGAGGAQPKLKKRKPGTPAPVGIKTEPGTPSGPGLSSAGPGPAPQVAPGTELTTAILVAWLRASPGTTTRDCIHYFQPCLTDDGKKARFTALVKEVASLKGGVLALKAQYRDGVVDDSKV